MSAAWRLADGGLIDRTKPVRFRFDGQAMTGYAGDTLASALLANGVRLFGRSFKYHRPRGLLSAGVEEPSALVGAGVGGRFEPNTRATDLFLYDGLDAHSQNRWPSLQFDAMAVNQLIAPFIPAGFYYKTFLGPPSLWKLYEHAIRAAAGLGKPPQLPDADAYERRAAFCDVLVVGAGPAGLSAALSAARSGARVAVCDLDARPGGSLLGDPATIADQPSADWIAAAIAELESIGARLLFRTTAFGFYDHNMVYLAERGDRAGRQADLRRHRPAPVAHAGGGGGAGARGHRAALALRRERPARRDAGGRRADLCEPLRREAGVERGGRHQRR